jgi:superfamily II DNA or RNA helicase
MTPRPYQADALGATAALVKQGARRLIIAVPTGGGKTIIFSYLAESLGLKPSDKILILAHRDELVQQAVEKYLSVNPGEMVGVEKANLKAKPMDRVCVASVQTLHNGRIADFLARFGYPALIITDEAHHAVASGYKAIYEACKVTKDGPVIHVGVTATPKRSDKIGLDGTYDVVAYSIGIADLVKQGYLVPLMGYRVQTNTSLDDVKTVAGEFIQADLGKTVDTPHRNARVVQAYQDIVPGRKALVFAATVAHSEHLAEMFAHAGYRTAHVDGETAQEKRRAILAAFKNGDLDVLCNCAVLTEGYDEPSLEAIIIARPTKSTVLYAQMIGRATRTNPGKSKAAIIDMVDATRKHSVITLPALLGLPPNFNLGGRDATKLAEKWSSMAEADPTLATMVHDAATLLKLEGLAPAERMAALVKQLMEKAKAAQTYVPVDLLRPASMPSEFDEFSRMTWVPLSDDAYRLRLRDGSVFLEGNVVGDYKVRVQHANGNVTHLGTHKGYRDAFTAAEAWVRSRRGENLNFLDRTLTWRKKGATDKQIAILKKHNVQGAKSMTAGEASDAIDRILDAMARGQKAS